jgi:hypothetical protein
MKFDCFDRLTESVGCPCPSDRLAFYMDDPKVALLQAKCDKALAAGDKEAYSAAKRRLPFVTWQASFRDHQRSNANAIPSGLFMLDVDHIGDMAAFDAEVIEPLRVNDWALARQLGIAVIHLTPSREGYHFVAKCPVGMTTIEGCQRWLTQQLGIMTYDEQCKDFARGSFVVPRDMFVFLDYKALYDEEAVNILRPTPDPSREGGEALPLTGERGEGPQERVFSEAQKTFTYRGHLISDIAAMWVQKHGEPQMGERHTYYYRMCNLFRYITDGDMGVLLAQLPDFGLSIAEREKEAEHACRRATATQIPYTFYKFLVDSEIISVEKPAEKAIHIDLSDATPSVGKNAPWLPPVFREFCKNCPADFVYPTIVALLPVLGTLATRLRARYLDGREHTPSFISVIFAPQSAGKSFARDIVTALTPDLRRHDEISILKERQYKAELRLKKNSDQLPEDPHAPYRLVQAVISVPRLLQRQEDAGGLHQLSFVEEIDTLTKSNAGGSYAQKSDLYRQAFDNAEYGQDYLSVDTFTGSVRLYYNLLMLGTPKQLYKFFNDAENGLVSRCAFAELQNQEFAPIPYFHPLTPKQQEDITKVLNRFEAMTYRRRNAQSEDYVVLPTVNIDEKMQPIREALTRWLEKTRLEALESGDTATDVFRRRAAVKAFRLGMVCVGMYERRSLTPKVMARLVDFITWFAQQDTEQSVRAFGRMIEESQQSPGSYEKQVSLFKSLPDAFTAGELMAWQRKLKKSTPARVVLSKWKLQGLIEQTADGNFKKLKK